MANYWVCKNPHPIACPFESNASDGTSRIAPPPLSKTDVLSHCCVRWFIVVQSILFKYDWVVTVNVLHILKKNRLKMKTWNLFQVIDAPLITPAQLFQNSKNSNFRNTSGHKCFKSRILNPCGWWRTCAFVFGKLLQKSNGKHNRHLAQQLWH